MFRGVNFGRLQKTLEVTVVTQSMPRNHLIVSKSSLEFVKGNKNREMENTRLFVHKAYLITDFMFIYNFVLSFTPRVRRFSSTATCSLLWLFFFNSRKTTWYWHSENAFLNVFERAQTFDHRVLFMTGFFCILLHNFGSNFPRHLCLYYASW